MSYAKVYFSNLQGLTKNYAFKCISSDMKIRLPCLNKSPLCFYKIDFKNLVLKYYDFISELVPIKSVHFCQIEELLYANGNNMFEMR